jgi:demethylmenaquinone methyltransferase/2-methoxy-6-polyprenyl-1,4-benzoquinol methylase
MVGSSFDAHAPLDGFKLRGEDKLAFVSDMFDRVAPTYDLLNHFISLGQTTMWRLLALTRLGGQRGVLRPGAKILDVGCGTGWVTWFFGWYYRGMALDVEGMDCSKVMLDEARKINPDARFTIGNVCDLRYESNSFDAGHHGVHPAKLPGLGRGHRGDVPGDQARRIRRRAGRLPAEQ